jgi:hypothetical protein
VCSGQGRGGRDRAIGPRRARRSAKVRSRKIPCLVPKPRVKVESGGKVVEAAGKVVEAAGKVVEAAGKVVEAGGKVVEAAGRVVEVGVNVETV